VENFISIVLFFSIDWEATQLLFDLAFGTAIQDPRNKLRPKADDDSQMVEG
jgi:hypothetical protein